MVTPPAPVDNARDRIIVAAERLIAAQGPAASLREIAAAAGHRNTGAVQYHFGSRDALIEAIVERRQLSLERERLVLLAQHEAAGRTDLHGLVDALVAPLFSVPYSEGSTHYARFLEKVRDHPSIVALRQRDWPASQMIGMRIDGTIVGLSSDVRKVRYRAMVTMMFALLADLERAGPSKATRVLAEANIIDMIVAALTAPVSGDRERASTRS